MSKRIQLTERLKELIRLASDNQDFDFSKIAAYESVAASTRPISQRATAYNGAMMTESFLMEMASYLTKESVPMLTMHEGSMLPIGKVFHADVLEAEGGHKDLNALFYVEADGEFAEKIDLGIIDEVSVGALPEHAFCSQCEFDYMAEGNEMNFYFRECDNGHELGKEGTHLRLTKLNSWKELSLVGKGASDKPKIVGSTKQRLGKERYDSLAATGASPLGVEMAYLLCSATPPENNDDEGTDMNLKDITDQVATLSADKAKLEVGLETAKASLQASEGKVAALQDEVTQLKADLAKTDESELAKEVELLKAQASQNEALQTFFSEEVKKAAVAAELTLEDDATVEQKIQLMKDAQVRLAAIPRGAQTQSPVSASDTAGDQAVWQRNSAFLTKV